jgi:hypothetical protein
LRAKRLLSSFSTASATRKEMSFRGYFLGASRDRVRSGGVSRAVAM